MQSLLQRWRGTTLAGVFAALREVSVAPGCRCSHSLARSSTGSQTLPVLFLYFSQKKKTSGFILRSVVMV